MPAWTLKADIHGPQGYSVDDAEILPSGHLQLTLTDGSVIDAGQAQGAPGQAGVNAVANDTATGSYIDSATTTVTNTAMETRERRVVHRGPKTLAGVNVTLDRAEAMGKYTIAYFPAGTYDVGNGWSLTGRTAQIQGAGGATLGAVNGGTVFHGSTQTGPVIDFTDWVVPTDSLGQVFGSRVTHGGFLVRGSGVADPTKVRSGVRLKIMSSANFLDISVRDTGGPAWEHVASPGNAVYLCDLERIILYPPVNAGPNDVPYMRINEANGVRFRGVGFRNNAGSSDGVSGVLVIEDNATWTGYDNIWDGIWFEWIHVPTNGCIISVKANTTLFHQIGWHDCVKMPGATGTAFIRLKVPTAQNYGGNIVAGMIPGTGGTATEMDLGIEVLQSGNRITGVRGSAGKNVTIQAGVQRTFVELGGTQSGISGNAVVDNSGNTTNVIIDNTIGTHRVNRMEVKDSVTPANGSLAIGGAFLIASAGSLANYGDNLRLYNPAGTAPGVLQLGAGAGVYSGAGTPEGVVAASPGSLYLNTSGGASTSLYVKQSGTGATGWAAK